MNKLKCPKCDSPVFIMCLTSNPPQYECECKNQDFKLKYYEREDPFKHTTQKELNEYFISKVN